MESGWAHPASVPPQSLGLLQRQAEARDLGLRGVARTLIERCLDSLLSRRDELVEALPQAFVELG